MRRLAVAVTGGVAFIIASPLGCGQSAPLPSNREPPPCVSGASTGGCPCVDGDVEPCGLSLGACRAGQRVCRSGTWQACAGAVGPSDEACNAIDDDCDGKVDDGFGVGEPCDGPDSDRCEDDVRTCKGCAEGADDVEVCNGHDDDCNGVVDTDCAAGTCTATLDVSEVSLSSATCFVDGLQSGAAGTLRMPCGGGSVAAQFGSMRFVGKVTGGALSLEANTEYPYRDGCTWKTKQRLSGSPGSGTLTYAYEEVAVGKDCLTPCTATGSVRVGWQ
jgi:hypothetical protein